MAKVIKGSDTDTTQFTRYERATLESYVLASDPAEGAMDASTEGPEGEQESPETLEQRLEREYAQIIAEARAEAETKVREAYEEGHRRGLEAGIEEVRAQVRGLLATIGDSARVVEDAKAEAARRLESGFMSLTHEIVLRVLRREAWADSETVRRVLRDVLERLGRPQRIRVRLHPRDLEAARSLAGDLLDDAVSVEFAADEAVTPGGCVVDTDRLCVDARIDAQLERILEGLMEVPCEPHEPA